MLLHNTDVAFFYFLFWIRQSRNGWISKPGSRNDDLVYVFANDFVFCPKIGSMPIDGEFLARKV